MNRVIAFALLTLLIPTATAAQVRNGSFDRGAESWEVAGDWTFPAAGGRPGALALLGQARSGSLRQTFTIDANADEARVVLFDYRVVMFDGDPTDGHSAFPVMSAGLVGEITRPMDEVVSDWQTFRLSTTGGEHTFVLSAIAVYGTMSLSVDNVRVESAVATDSPSWGGIKALYQ